MENKPATAPVPKAGSRLAQAACLAPPPVRVTCTLPGASMRCSTGSLALQVPLLLVSWQMIQPQSQSWSLLGLVQLLVLDSL